MSGIRIRDKKDEAIARKIFDDMWSSLSINAEGIITYGDFTLFEDMLPILTKILDTDNTITAREKAGFIQTSVLELPRNGQKQFQQFLSSMDARISDMLSKPKSIYYLSTTVSLRRHSHEHKLTKRINESLVSIRSDYPKKLNANEWFLNGFGTVRPGEPRTYARLYARTRARTRDQAARAMLADIELLLACLNMFYSSGRMVYIGEARPISEVRLGKFQLIHDEKGRIDQERISYEPSYEEIRFPKSLQDNFDALKNFTDEFFKRLRQSPIRSLIESSIRQFNAALNMKNPQLCLFRLWASLETLMKSGLNGSKITAKRASFFAANHDYQRLRLLHIAEVRNAYVHAGTDIDLVDPLIQGLKVYIASIYRLLLFANLTFRNEDEYVQVLDLPPEPSQIEQRITVGRMGLKLRR